jgi:hypothetical protein
MMSAVSVVLDISCSIGPHKAALGPDSHHGVRSGWV